ncbi:GNAT family N-acetyltransferase [Arenibacter echinorum]|uniref:Acetyltransferase (GNAT) family protein n=1 Tax=Arenibacter echinorum TaxID=440515 RepID=A0A327RIL7_9FLAO|nr:GNAT family N-acetyltransferase [Arenibacter echinorum]RAJ16035.1 acetyltransferase (GNAT) family protein [Arenibacter echinorum]
MLRRLNFFFEFFEKNSILPFYESLTNNINGQIIYNENTEGLKAFENGLCVCVVNMIPPYFDFKIDNRNKLYRAFQVKYRTGFIMDLSQYANADEYLKSHLGSRHRKNILSKIKRLESCFDISYKTHYGAIDDLEYKFLFEEFERMIRDRFKQRGEEHVGLKRWNLYKENVYELILKARASLFVIYDGKKPISINLNYHFENILDSAITSYDIDYAKFGLGNIAVYKKMEWCFQNDYQRIDMRWGELYYKRLWSNAIEEYKCDVVYNNLFIAMPIAFMVARLIIFKKFLFQHKILPFNLSFRSRQKPSQNVESNSSPSFKIENLTELPFKDGLSLVSLEDKKFEFLRNPVYNFQYSNSEHSNNINIYRVNNDRMSYIIAGKSQLQKLVF